MISRTPQSVPSCSAAGERSTPRRAKRRHSYWAAAAIASATACAPIHARQLPSPAGGEHGLDAAAASSGSGEKLLRVAEKQAPTAAFVLGGKPFCFQGANNYYAIYKSRRMVDDVFAQARAMNLKVIRLWGFLDRGSLDGAVPSVDGDGTKDGVYFRYWDSRSARPVLNEAENGLPRLDYVLHAARQHGVRVLLVLTNNWREFGGMDQMLTWYGLNYHDEFYTDARVKGAFKDYAAALANRVNTVNGKRYRDDETIFAWELANEPRSKNGRGMDRDTGWDHTTIVRWADEMSTYIRSIAPNHLIAVGDEGFLRAGGAGWLYAGEAGVDHRELSALPNVDFATFHLYPDTWGMDEVQAYEWINAHLDVARELGKPTILEEYGTIVRRDPRTREVTWGLERRRVAYTNWNELVRRGGGNAALFWMLAGVDDRRVRYPDYDQYQVYGGDPTAKLLGTIAKQYELEAAACKYAVDVSDIDPHNPFVKVKPAMNPTAQLDVNAGTSTLAPDEHAVR